MYVLTHIYIHMTFLFNHQAFVHVVSTAKYTHTHTHIRIHGVTWLGKAGLGNKRMPVMHVCMLMRHQTESHRTSHRSSLVQTLQTQSTFNCSHVIHFGFALRKNNLLWVSAPLLYPQHWCSYAGSRQIQSFHKFDPSHICSKVHTTWLLWAVDDKCYHRLHTVYILYVCMHTEEMPIVVQMWVYVCETQCHEVLCEIQAHMDLYGWHWQWMKHWVILTWSIGPQVSIGYRPTVQQTKWLKYVHTYVHYEVHWPVTRHHCWLNLQGEKIQSQTDSWIIWRLTDCKDNKEQCCL